MSRLASLTLALLCLAALPPGAAAAPAFALAGDGSTLIRFNTDQPGAVHTVGALSGATTQLDGLDFRPADRQLYGYSAATSGVYRVDPLTGATTLVSVSTQPLSGAVVGIDFNPVPDRLRVVSNQQENRRINVDTGVALADGTLSYAAGDANSGAAPRVADVAYTNSDTDPATGTRLYYIDHALDILATTDNPNAGLLTTVGALGVDTDEFVGFDIFTDASGINTAFATLRVGGVTGLFSIDLATGAAKRLGELAASQVNGLAVSRVPNPGSLALAATALLMVGLRGRPARAARAQARG